MKKKLLIAVLFCFILCATKMTCSAGEILQQTNFNNGQSLPWTLFESNEVNSYAKVSEGAYMVHINKDQMSREIWDIQIRHREFVIQKDHKYNVRFKVRATKPCKIRAKIGDADDKRYWKEYWFKEVSVTPTWLTVTGSFEADSSYDVVEFAIHFGGDNLNGNEDFDIFFDDMSLQDFQFTPTPTPVPTPERLIGVNQLGYYPDAMKRATLTSNSTSAVDVQLKDSKGQVVWTGKSNPKGYDQASMENVHIIDFSDFKVSGKDYQLIAGTATSMQFDIATDMYTKLKYDALKYFYYARSGIEITMPYCVDSKWARPAGHMEDVATLYTQKVYSDGVYTGGPETLNGTGGWYNDGDNGKYVVNGGFATWLLQNQYERAAQKGIKAFEDNTMNIPESDNDYPDLLDEARWNMEYFLKVQIPEGDAKAGMVIYKLSDEHWVALGIRPDQDGQKRFFYPPSTDSTLNFAACAAQAARIWRKYDAAFADKCLSAAEIAWKAALDYPDVIAPLNMNPDYDEKFLDNTPEDEF